MVHHVDQALYRAGIDSREPPGGLRCGDVVEASIKGRYVRWYVRQQERNDGDNRQRIVASAPGVGSVRFEWRPAPHNVGYGHGLKFYFVRRPGA